MSNEIPPDIMALKSQVEFLRGELAQWKQRAAAAEAKMREAVDTLTEIQKNWMHTCVHHNDAERTNAASKCPVCTLAMAEKAERALANEKQWSEDLAKQVCEMENALGFKQDQHGPNGEFVPTMGPWKERVRDLIAKEGELEEANKVCAEMRDALEALQRVLPDGWWQRNEYYGKIQALLDSTTAGTGYLSPDEVKELLKYKERLEWLHAGGGIPDSEGYEWGVARVKFDAHGQVQSVLWTNSDHSDLDAEMEREKNAKVKPY